MPQAIHIYWNIPLEFVQQNVSLDKVIVHEASTYDS